MNRQYRARLNQIAEKFRRDCERNTPEACAYCLGVEPNCRLAPTDHGKMHPKCAHQACVTLQYTYPEFDHA